MTGSSTYDPLDPLDASLRDLEPTTPPTTFGFPRRRLSGFRSDDTESDLADPVDSPGGYSPPAWRRLGNGSRDSGFWRRTDDRLLGGGRFPVSAALLASRESSPEGDGDDDQPARAEDVLRQAMRTRLPAGSVSPDKGRSPSPGPGPAAAGEGDATVKMGHVPWDRRGGPDADDGPRAESENYIRFQLRADVQQRTEPLDAAVRFLRTWWRAATGSWSSLVLSVLVAVVSMSTLRSLSQPGPPRAMPDLVKVAGIARSFEPLIYFSENGASQVSDLQATGVAVWDLGESVRTSNMTSAPIMVRELDELSDSLKTLAVELTRFFANVDGDIDGILLVMEWAHRELSTVRGTGDPPRMLSAAYDNVHEMLSRAGVLETADGRPTRLGALSAHVLGPSRPQRARQALQRTFHEFLAVLEEAINNELQHSLALFALFEAIDRQFLNLARTVVREASAQDERHADLLSSLWTRILGPDAGEVAKYERNRRLLRDVRERTVRNKGVLVEHNGRLLSLKASLENVRRKLVSPLVRSANSSTLTLEEQVEGLRGVHAYLDGVRSRQKGKMMELLYGSGGAKRRTIERDAY